MHTQKFVHLHLHSKYSPRDGMIGFEDLFPRLKELGMDAVALTDHNTMAGVPEFVRQSKAAGVKPIIGCEVCICDDMIDRAERRHYRVVLLARDARGYENLCYLVSKAYLDGFYYHPRIDKKLLKDHSAGLIGLSGGLGGEIEQVLMASGYEAGKALALSYRDIFAPGCFFLEMQPNGLPDQCAVNVRLQILARETGIGLVATSGAHYLRVDDAKAHAVLLAIQQGRTLTVPELTQQRGDFHLHSADEMAQAFADCPTALENTAKIADMCNVDLPVLETGQERGPMALRLRLRAQTGLEMRIAEHGKHCDDTDRYASRLKAEIDSINSSGAVLPFLVAADCANWAKANGIPVGPGRGAVAGSLVAWALGITDVDPIEHGLQFERLLRPGVAIDIDLDVCAKRRGEVVEHLMRKAYGRDNVAGLSVPGPLSAKSAIKDVGRVMGMLLSDIQTLTARIPVLINGEPARMQWIKEHVPQVQRAMEQPQTAEVIEIATALEGVVRNTATHVGAVVVSLDRPLWSVVPCRTGMDGEMVVQYTKKETEAAGLLVIDLLKLDALTIIDRAVSLVRERQPGFIMPKSYTDASVYKMIAAGDTDGVFMLGFDGIKDLLRQVKPDCFADLVAVHTLYRPGPIDGGVVARYVVARQSLAESHGIILYHEQIAQIIHDVAGYSLADAHALRVLLAKKKPAEVEPARVAFISVAAAQGVETVVASSIFGQLLDAAGYAYCKAHAVCMAILMYQMAYLKCHHPEEFGAALRENSKDAT